MNFCTRPVPLVVLLRATVRARSSEKANKLINATQRETRSRGRRVKTGVRKISSTLRGKTRHYHTYTYTGRGYVNVP
uniref:Putative secreted protein n=1 Tax=Anopheles darlingi TaxID=43151 RepID=A0A2M4DFB4_ANODA